VEKGLDLDMNGSRDGAVGTGWRGGF